MSTPLVALASILAFFALILIPLMMMKPGTEEKPGQGRDQGHQGKKFKKKKRP